jgi:hypothetical protein
MRIVFIGASWSRREEARRLADDLWDHDICVNSSWLYQNDDMSTSDCIYNDLRDLRNCDIFVRLSDDLTGPTVPSYLATGARMFEQALAYGMGKQIYVIGGKQMIYDNMPCVQHVKTEAELIRSLCPTIQ